MVNLREQAEADLSFTLEGEWRLPVELIDPDGNIINESENSPDPLNPLALYGQVLYDIVQVNPETGEQMIINDPIVSIRRSSLPRIPEAGEKWLVKIPTDPSETATLEDFVIDPTRPPEGGRSLGFIRLYLRRAAQL